MSEIRWSCLSISSLLFCFLTFSYLSLSLFFFLFPFCYSFSNLSSHSTFLRYFSTLNSGRWALPTLRVLLLDLRQLSIRTDLTVTLSAAASVSRGVAVVGGGGSNSSNKRLEECARQLNKAFSSCIGDRSSDLDGSKKWGTYEIVGLVFSTYFRVSSRTFCEMMPMSIDAFRHQDLLTRTHHFFFLLFSLSYSSNQSRFARISGELFQQRNSHLWNLSRNQTSCLIDSTWAC